MVRFTLNKSGKSSCFSGYMGCIKKHLAFGAWGTKLKNPGHECISSEMSSLDQNHSFTIDAKLTLAAEAK